MYTDLINKQVGTLIAKRRKECNLPLHFVATSLRITRSQLYRYESGESTLTVPNLYRLGAILNVDPSSFLEPLEGASLLQSCRTHNTNITGE